MRVASIRQPLKRCHIRGNMWCLCRKDGQSCKSKFVRKFVADGLGQCEYLSCFYRSSIVWLHGEHTFHKILVFLWLILDPQLIERNTSPLASAKCTDTCLLLGSDEQPLLWCALAFIGTLSIHTVHFLSSNPHPINCRLSCLNVCPDHWFTQICRMHQNI